MPASRTSYGLTADRLVAMLLLIIEALGDDFGKDRDGPALGLEESDPKNTGDNQKYGDSVVHGDGYLYNSSKEDEGEENRSGNGDGEDGTQENEDWGEDWDQLAAAEIDGRETLPDLKIVLSGAQCFTAKELLHVAKPYRLPHDLLGQYCDLLQALFMSQHDMSLQNWFSAPIEVFILRRAFQPDSTFSNVHQMSGYFSQL
ncbi:hypothetical protein BV22DRAFT_1051464 [Leucogyrophana mollusca]|uniref:Uncharacterized protein n=1 Tax=Leucogyrophana mollusca TaxID=85980 RepID=A0ACB8AZK7_9AGAM|nr:hypothetical protein BV22DRAFT_1051464 [Leucogyrophana mollusca]